MSVIENLLVSFFLFSVLCWASRCGSVWDLTFLYASHFDPSRHKLLPPYWATEEGFELSLPLSDLSEHSLLIGSAAGSLWLSWIRRNRGNQEDFSASRMCARQRFTTESREERDLRFNTGVEWLNRASLLIVNVTFLVFSFQQQQHPLTFAFSEYISEWHKCFGILIWRTYGWLFVSYVRFNKKLELQIKKAWWYHVVLPFKIRGLDLW